MALGEGLSARVAFKPYATGVITANTQPTSSSDLGASSAQILRRTACSLNLSKDTYQSAEIRTDRQIADFRHGVKRVQGSLSGELSPGTYWDFLEAGCRGTETAAVAKSNTELTSVAASASAKTITFGGGDPVSEGFRVGMTVRLTNTAEALNNSTNFLITGFSGGSNRTMGVHPAPTDAGADTSFNIVSVGKRVAVPESSFVARKFGVEVYHEDLDIYRLFTELRVGGINLALPATGMSTIEVAMMGRDMETGSGGSAPFFTSPTAIGTTGLLTSVNGLVRVGGVNQGVVTGAQVSFNLSPDAPAVVGQNFVPEIFLGRANVSGQLTAFLEDLTLLNAFKNETDIELLLWLLASTSATSDTMSIYMPRIKFGDAQVGIEGEQGVPITIPWQGLKYATAGAGIEATTIAFCDTAA